MLKLKQPATLERLAVRALGRAVGQSAAEAIASGVITRGLQDYLYGELPDVLCEEVSAHMLAEVLKTLTNGDNTRTDVSDATNTALLEVVCHRITDLDLSNAPRFAVKTLCSNLQTFTKLRTLVVRGCPVDVAETLTAGLSSLKFLAHFEMTHKCTDAVIETLGSCCFATIQHIDVRFSTQVTDASFKDLLECRELKRLLICDTSVTAQGFGWFLYDRTRDVTAKGFLSLGVGSNDGWNGPAMQLNDIALYCPTLKCLEVYSSHGNVGALLSLTALEVLTVHGGQFAKCSFHGLSRAPRCNITSLTLDRTQSIDLAAIVNHCVSIRRLCVEDGSVTMGDLETEACRCLEDLSLSCDFSPPSIEGVLYACVNLTTLFLNPRKEHLTDELILRVLSKNPLQKLTSFKAWCPQLTMRSLDAIVEQCRLLEELAYVYCDRAIRMEVKILQDKIESRNQGLEAGSSR